MENIFSSFSSTPSSEAVISEYLCLTIYNIETIRSLILQTIFSKSIKTFDICLKTNKYKKDLKSFANILVQVFIFSLC